MDAMTFYMFYVFLGWSLLPGMCCFYIAKEKGRSPGAWAALSLITAPLVCFFPEMSILYPLVISLAMPFLLYLLPSRTAVIEKDDALKRWANKIGTFFIAGGLIFLSIVTTFMTFRERGYLGEYTVSKYIFTFKSSIPFLVYFLLLGILYVKRKVGFRGKEYLEIGLILGPTLLGMFLAYLDFNRALGICEAFIGKKGNLPIFPFIINHAGFLVLWVLGIILWMSKEKTQEHLEAQHPE